MANTTNYENTRNDSYLIIEKDKALDCVVSYGKNLIDYVNEKLSANFSKDTLENDKEFRKVISKLDEAGYYVFQLTRL